MEAFAWVGVLLMACAYALLVMIPLGVLAAGLATTVATGIFRLARKGEPVSKAALGLGKGSAAVLGFLGGATAGLLIFWSGAKLFDPADGYTVHGLPAYFWIVVGIAEVAGGAMLRRYAASLSTPSPPSEPE